jgi:hypothetical protein
MQTLILSLSSAARGLQRQKMHPAVLEQAVYFLLQDAEGNFKEFGPTICGDPGFLLRPVDEVVEVHQHLLLPQVGKALEEGRADIWSPLKFPIHPSDLLYPLLAAQHIDVFMGDWYQGRTLESRDKYSPGELVERLNHVITTRKLQVFWF